MGKWGLLVNVVALAYSCFALFWSLWPGTSDITVDTFNWSVVIFGGVFVVSLGMYVVKGRREYNGPVVAVRGRLD
jgi:hypothetical protein